MQVFSNKKLSLPEICNVNILSLPEISKAKTLSLPEICTWIKSTRRSVLPTDKYTAPVLRQRIVQQ